MPLSAPFTPCPSVLTTVAARLQVFVNREGGIVLSFDSAAAAAEGDLAAYMNSFVKADSLTVEFR
jgi:hypothetical protein